jgi:hypothetical protein
MKSKIYLPAFFLVIILSSGSLFVNKPSKSTGQGHAPNRVRIETADHVWKDSHRGDDNTSSIAVTDVKMRVTVPGKLPSGPPPVLQFYIFLSSQIQCWIWEMQPRNIAKFN